VLYGRLYVSEEELDDLLQRALDLRTAMQESERASEKVRDRNYKYHRRDFRDLIADFGAIFLRNSKQSEEEERGVLRSVVSISVPNAKLQSSTAIAQ
jgi:hypothetical protein